jgi:peptide/nickel transport system substrate-binding protein
MAKQDLKSLHASLCLLALLGLALCNAGCGKNESKPSRPNRIVVSKTVGPRTFNRLFATDEVTASILDCINARLIRIDRQTQQAEGELVTQWQLSPDGKTLDCDLRSDAKFSDGQPFTAEDVLFTFQVLQDPKVASPLAGTFQSGGRQMKAEKLGEHKVRFVFSTPMASVERLFDGIAILPKHALEPAYRDGKFAEVWNIATPPAQVIGLGPFKLKEVVADQRIVMARNEHYWKKDAGGKQLPYLDELIVSIDSDRSAQVLKFQNGETDLLYPVNVDDVPALQQLEQQGKIRLMDMGPSQIREIFWFNLNDGKSKAGKPLLDPVKRAWFSDVRFRQAVSHAIDRDAIVSVVFAGKAAPQFGFLSAGDKLWRNDQVRKYPYDLERAKSLLKEAGFRYTSGNDLIDAEGRPVAFTLLTNAGNALRQKMSTMIQTDLARIGIQVNLASIESRALLATINESFAYEACLLAVVSGDADPNSHGNILTSAGSSHWWHPGQKQARTPWEAQIDALMEKQRTTLDPAQRKELFNQVQALMAEQQPFIFLASRHLLVAARPDIGNLKPATLPDFVLWNADELNRK